MVCACIQYSLTQRQVDGMTAQAVHESEGVKAGAAVAAVGAVAAAAGQCSAAVTHWATHGSCSFLPPLMYYSASHNIEHLQLRLLEPLELALPLQLVPSARAFGVAPS